MHFESLYRREWERDHIALDLKLQYVQIEYTDHAVVRRTRYRHPYALAHPE